VNQVVLKFRRDRISGKKSVNAFYKYFKEKCPSVIGLALPAPVCFSRDGFYPDGKT